MTRIMMGGASAHIAIYPGVDTVVRIDEDDDGIERLVISHSGVDLSFGPLPERDIDVPLLAFVDQLLSVTSSYRQRLYTVPG